MNPPMICPACWERDAEPDTADGGCVHYWQHRCDELAVALDDLAGEVNESGIDTAEHLPLFESWMRATTTLQSGKVRA